MEEEHDLLTTKEVAERLRVSKMTVNRMIHAGLLEAIRPGRSYRIKRASFQAFLDSRTEGKAQ